MKKKLYGYAGTVLCLDLGGGGRRRRETSEYAPRFLGGRGINQALLWKALPLAGGCFDPGCPLCIGAGALTGTPAPGASRLNVDSLNALTGGIGSGNAGGWFAAELRFAGYDNLIVTGRSEKPVYLWLEDDHVELRPATHLWGKSVPETERLIREELGREDIQVLCIGPAGEKRVRTSCIVVSGSRVVGRCGLGAVMGAKNLKAVAVRGTGSIALKEGRAYLEKCEEISRRLRAREGSRAIIRYGTLSCTPAYNSLSALCYRNYRDDHIPEEHLARISHQRFEQAAVYHYACASCPLPCARVYRPDGPEGKESACLKAEANSVWNFGGRLALSDPRVILACQEACRRLGLDIDNSSAAIAWAVDCYRNGLLTRADTGGLELDWGDGEMVLELLHRIAAREGFGDLLAEGSLRAARRLGRGSERYVFHVKGQDLIEGIRSMKGWALGVVVSARGATHTRGALASERSRWSEADSLRTFGVATAGDARTYEGKAAALVAMERANALWDALGVCYFTVNRSDPEGMNPAELAGLYSLATGRALTSERLMAAGERLHTLEKMINVAQAGFTRQEDYPPARLMTEPIASGPLAGELLKREDWDRMLDEYYSLHGWDPADGRPTRESLQAAGLEECLDALT